MRGNGNNDRRGGGFGGGNSGSGGRRSFGGGGGGFGGGGGDRNRGRGGSSGGGFRSRRPDIGDVIDRYTENGPQDREAGSEGGNRGFRENRGDRDNRSDRSDRPEYSDRGDRGGDRGRRSFGPDRRRSGGGGGGFGGRPGFGRDRDRDGGFQSRPPSRQTTALIRVKQLENFSGLEMPSFATLGSSGMDLQAAISKDVTIKKGEVALVPTGLSMAIPLNYEVQVRSRSGLALKSSVFVLNSPGTIDSDYRGEVGVILANLGKEDFVVTRGMKIAQMVTTRVEKPILKVVEDLDSTPRGQGGFGSTGTGGKRIDEAAAEDGKKGEGQKKKQREKTEETKADADASNSSSQSSAAENAAQAEVASSSNVVDAQAALEASSSDNSEAVAASEK